MTQKLQNSSAIGSVLCEAKLYQCGQGDYSWILLLVHRKIRYLIISGNIPSYSFCEKTDGQSKSPVGPPGAWTNRLKSNVKDYLICHTAYIRTFFATFMISVKKSLFEENGKICSQTKMHHVWISRQRWHFGGRVGGRSISQTLSRICLG